MLLIWNLPCDDPCHWYLELAVRRSLPLATLDSALARAARAAGVEVFGG
jgi:hypothetical protein